MLYHESMDVPKPTSPKPADPFIPGQLEPVTDAAALRVQPEDDGIVLAHVHLTGACAPDADFTLTDVSESRLQGCDFSGAAFAKATFTDVEVINCNFANADLTEANFTRCIFRSCKLTGAQFGQSVFARVELADCAASLASFERSKMQDIRVTSSDFSNADLSEVKQQRTAFENVKFEGTSFFRMRLAGINLSTCILKDITLSDTMDELQGCTMDLYQAASIARRLGVTVV